MKHPLLVSCALALSTTAWAQTLVRPKSLPGDLVPAPSAGNQDHADIALGLSTSLVVWDDDRTSALASVFGSEAAGTNVPGNKDIFGVLVDPAVGVLSLDPIVIDHEAWDQIKPRVAFNGSDYLVVFESTQPTAFYKSQGIYGVRVSAMGVVLDATPIRIADLDPDEETAPVIASAGGSWMVAWSSTGPGSFGQIAGAIVSANGSVGPVSTLVPGAITGAPTDVCIASANGRYLVAAAMTGARLECRLFDASGSAIGSPFDATTASDIYQPAAASNGSEFYLTWFGGGVQGVRGTPISSNGVVGTPGGQVLEAYAGDLGVAWDGTQWVVALQDFLTVKAVRVSAAGLPLSSAQVVTASTNNIGSISIGNGSGRTSVVWADHREAQSFAGIDPSDIFGASFESTGTAGVTRPVSISVPCQIGSRIAGNENTGFLVVYHSLTSGRTRILAQPVGADGVALTGEPFEVESGDRSLGEADVAFANGVFLVTWHHIQSTSQTGPPTLVKTRRMLIDGTFLDAMPQTLMEGNSPCVDSVGGTFLVVARYRHVTLQFQPVVRGRRIDAATGNTPDVAPLLLQGGASGSTEVVGLADRWCAAWGGIAGRFVLADGSLLPTFQVAAMSNAPSSAVRMARNAQADRVTLVHQYRPAGGGAHTADVRMRRLALDGSALDPLAGVVVSGANQAQLLPAVAVLDGETLFAWSDHRAHPDIEPGLGDVYLARANEQGVVLDPIGIPVFTSNLAEGGVELYTCGVGRALVAIVRFEGETVATHRVRVGVFEQAGEGTGFCAGDGSATACPCNNAGSTRHGCAGSLNSNGALLQAFGTASASQDTLLLVGSGLAPSGCVYLQGTQRLNSGMGLLFGDGLLCVGGTVLRLGLKFSVGGASQYPALGDAPISALGGIVSPGTRTYQAWYRDAVNFCSTATFNFTNGVEITWTP